MSALTDSTGAVASVDSTMVCLLGGPYVLRAGQRLAVPDGSKRVLVFVALHGHIVDRRHLAGTLWPDGTEERAAGNLRSALWRLRGAGLDILEGDKCGLGLRAGTVVDIHRLLRWADSVIDGTSRPADWRGFNWNPEALALLPGWYDDWLLFERERLRQRMLHALEAVSYRLSDTYHHAEAVEAAMMVVQLDPLRESGQRALVCAHLAEGNFVEARRAYAACRQSLLIELGVEPSDDLTRLVESWPAPAPANTEQHHQRDTSSRLRTCQSQPIRTPPVTRYAGTR